MHPPSAPLPLSLLIALLVTACGARTGLTDPSLDDVVAMDIPRDELDARDAFDAPDTIDVFACTPGASRACYSGTPETRGVGSCRDGAQTCRPSVGGGATWGPCVGEVVPTPEQCDGIDHLCIGRPNPACGCMPGATQRCYTGPPGTEDVGTCHAGTQRCIPMIGAPGGMWAPCAGQILPAAPQCDGLDHECNGTVPACQVNVRCPPPVRVRSGATVTLTATASASPPSTVVSTLWSVTDSPAGSTYVLTAPAATTTQFSANAAGVYTVAFTATNSSGRTAMCTVLVTVTESYRGTEFWAATTANSQLLSGDRFHFAIGVGNPNATTVTVNVTGGALTAPDVFDVPANSTVTHTLPWVTGLVQNSGMLRGCAPDCCDINCCPNSTFASARSALAVGGGYHILTSQPVSVYQFNPLEFSVNPSCPSNAYTNDASLLLPTSALTGNYLVLTHNAWADKGSFVAIVGADVGPVSVRVTLRAGITAGTGVAAAAAGSTQTYVLNPGDVVQLVSTSGSSGSRVFGTQDLTGSVISATGAISVFAGVDCTNMSFPDGSLRACDHLEQQLFPVETWGNDVVVSQLRDRGPTENYIVRVLSREDGNAVTFTPPGVHAPVTLARGAFVEFESMADVLVHAAQPILVAQFMEGQFSTPGATMGDPSMVLEVPTAQYRRDYNFVVPASYTASFINVVGPASAMIRLDGTALLDADAEALAGTPWRVWRMAIMPGSHRIESATAAFGLKVLGVAERTSYAYPGGLDLGAM